MGGQKRAPAKLNRELVELSLIEKYHWLPQEIAQIPYKKLQMMFILRDQLDVAHDVKREVDSFKRESQSAVKGGKRKMTRRL